MKNASVATAAGIALIPDSKFTTGGSVTVLKGGLDALADGNVARARAVRDSLPGWPGIAALRRNGERAMAREKPSPQAVVQAFGNSKPQTMEGAVLLARAHIALGNAEAARTVLSPFWAKEKLEAKDEAAIMWEFGKVIRAAVHRARMEKMFMTTASIRQESEFNVGAVSGAGARGLPQLLPGTAKEMARTTGLGFSQAKLTSDATYNATLGSAYLSSQLDRFGGSYVLTFAAYNAGPRRASEWVARYGDPRGQSVEAVVDWIERIPVTETRH